MSERDSWTESWRESLVNHEEPYQLGAWERFEAHRASRDRFRVWRRGFAAAALLLVGLGLFWFVTPGVETGELVVSSEDGIPTVREVDPGSVDPDVSNEFDENRGLADGQRPDGSMAVDPEDERAVDRSRGPSDSGSVQPGDGNVAGSANSPALTAFAASGVFSEPNWMESAIRGRPLGADTPARLSGEPGVDSHLSPSQGVRLETKRMSLSEGRVDHSEESSSDGSQAVRSSDLRPVRGDRDFAWGVAYAPMMNLHGGSAQMAMGAGVHARVQLSDGWGLGSALVLSRSQFQSDADPGEVNLFQTLHMADGGPTILDSRVHADLVSLEVPLNLRYELNETVALSGGLSTVAYLQETYHYRVDYRQSYFTAMSTEQGIQFESGERETTERVSESESPMSGLYWGAFYNVGAEFSWLVSNRHWVSVEPFVKIPSGGVATRDLTYSSGGVQLKLYF